MDCMHISACLHCKYSSTLLGEATPIIILYSYTIIYANVLTTALEVFLSQKIGNTTTTKALTQISKNHEEGNVSYIDALLELKTADLNFIRYK